MWRLLQLRKLCGNISKKFGKIAEIVFCGDVAAIEDRWLRPRGLSEMELSLIGDLRPDESPALPVTYYDAAFRTQGTGCCVPECVCECVFYFGVTKASFSFSSCLSQSKNPTALHLFFFHPRSNILLARKTRKTFETQWKAYFGIWDSCRDAEICACGEGLWAHLVSTLLIKYKKNTEVW